MISKTLSYSLSTIVDKNIMYDVSGASTVFKYEIRNIIHRVYFNNLVQFINKNNKGFLENSVLVTAKKKIQNVKYNEELLIAKQLTPTFYTNLIFYDKTNSRKITSHKQPSNLSRNIGGLDNYFWFENVGREYRKNTRFIFPTYNIKSNKNFDIVGTLLFTNVPIQNGIIALEERFVNRSCKKKIINTSHSLMFLKNIFEYKPLLFKEDIVLQKNNVKASYYSLENLKKNSSSKLEYFLNIFFVNTIGPSLFLKNTLDLTSKYANQLNTLFQVNTITNESKSVHESSKLALIYKSSFTTTGYSTTCRISLLHKPTLEYHLELNILPLWKPVVESRCDITFSKEYFDIKTPEHSVLFNKVPYSIRSSKDNVLFSKNIKYCMRDYEVLGGHKSNYNYSYKDTTKLLIKNDTSPFYCLEESYINYTKAGASTNFIFNNHLDMRKNYQVLGDVAVNAFYSKMAYSTVINNSIISVLKEPGDTYNSGDIFTISRHYKDTKDGISNVEINKYQNSVFNVSNMFISRPNIFEIYIPVQQNFSVETIKKLFIFDQQRYGQYKYQKVDIMKYEDFLYKKQRDILYFKNYFLWTGQSIFSTTSTSIKTRKKTLNYKKYDFSLILTQKSSFYQKEKFIFPTIPIAIQQGQSISRYNKKSIIEPMASDFVFKSKVKKVNVDTFEFVTDESTIDKYIIDKYTESSGIDELILSHNDFDYSIYEDNLIKDGSVNEDYIKRIEPTGEIYIKYPISNPVKLAADIAILYKDVPVNTLRYIIRKAYSVFKTNIFMYSGMKPDEAVSHIVKEMYCNLELQFSDNELYEAYRCCRLFRWYGEMSILNNSEYLLKLKYSSIIPNYIDNSTIELEKAVLLKNLYLSDNLLLESEIKNAPSSITLISNKHHVCSIKGKFYMYGCSLKITDNDEILQYDGEYVDLEFKIQQGERTIVLEVIPDSENYRVQISQFELCNFVINEYELIYQGKTGESNKTINHLIDTLVIVEDSYENMNANISKVTPITTLLEQMRYYFEIHHNNKDKGKRLINKIL